jgi:hypothetical protein
MQQLETLQLDPIVAITGTNLSAQRMMTKAEG